MIESLRGSNGSTNPVKEESTRVVMHLSLKLAQLRKIAPDMRGYLRPKQNDAPPYLTCK